MIPSTPAEFSFFTWVLVDLSRPPVCLRLLLVVMMTQLVRGVSPCFGQLLILTVAVVYADGKAPESESPIPFNQLVHSFLLITLDISDAACVYDSDHDRAVRLSFALKQWIIAIKEPQGLHTTSDTTHRLPNCLLSTVNSSISVIIIHHRRHRLQVHTPDHPSTSTMRVGHPISPSKT
jgi:hypothetical protein